MKYAIFATCCAVAISAAAQDQSPLWLRNTAISPDGSTIAFTYRGDIFTVPATGGVATQITSSQAYDTKPIWSPDGSTIVFASDRQGSLDLYAVEANGGGTRRITTHSATETPLAFLNDSVVLYSTNVMPMQSAAQPGMLAQVYAVPVDGGRPAVYASMPMGSIAPSADGRILCHDRKGFEDPLRKHQRAANTSDIWLIDGGKYTKLTHGNWHEYDPQWAGPNEYYYLAESDSTFNIYKRAIGGKPVQLTQHKRHPVRSLSASADGKMLAYSWNGEIYTLQPGQQPKRVDVSIVADNYDRDLLKGYQSAGAYTMDVAPSGDEVAFTLRGDVYVTSTKYNTTKRITNTGGQERSLSFSPDGKKLAYDSERDGLWQLFVASTDGDNFAYADGVTEELLYKGDRPAQQPLFSPDGKKVAFLNGRDEICVIDVDTKNVNVALDGKYNYSYTDGDVAFEWSPDSRWLLTSYIGVGGWNNADIALVKADGTEVIDLTESGYADNAPRWVLDGKGVTYTSGRYGYKSHGSWGEEQDVLLMVLDPDAWDDFNLSEEEAELKEKAEKDKKDGEKDDNADKKDKKDKKKGKDKKSAADEDTVKPLVFDLDNRYYRTRRLTPSASRLGDYWMSQKGDKLYYIAYATEGKSNLYCVDLKKGETKVLAPNVGRGSLLPDKKGEKLFLISGQGMSYVDLASGESKPIAFEAQYSRQPSVEREYMYDHAVRQVKEKFYDANLHGVDWDGYAADYRRFLPHISNNYDFSLLLSELLGELNASHTGSGYYAPGAPLPTASLGIFEDQSYKGDGIMVAEVLARGPLATKKADIAPGDIITSIDGEEILAGADYYPMLEGKAGKKVRLGVTKADGTKRHVEIRPIYSNRELLYQRWVERNERLADSISGGRIGYVHVKGMDSESFRQVYSKLLGKYRNCDAVVVDTRYNGGGWLHNDIALLLSGKEYVRYSPRGKFIGVDPFSQWTKPSVMLVNESNYSDAHGTPYTYQTLGIGKVVGAPVPGTMTAVWWETLIDPSLYFGIPQVTSLNREGRPMENNQLTPDVIIYNDPLEEQQGVDAQLQQAVILLMEQTAAK